MKSFYAAAIFCLLGSGWAFGELETDPPDAPDAAVEQAGEVIENEVMEDEAAVEDAAATEIPENLVPEKYRDDYFGGRPEKFLVDPQDLLSPVDYRERLDFLNYHAGDSAIDLYVHVFAADQDIPGEVRIEEVIERFFAEGRPAAVVCFYLGNPQRTTLHLSPSLMAVVPPGEQRRALESSVLQALKELHPAAQIEALLVQMSIRIYWMERMLGGAADAVPLLVKVKKSPEAQTGPFDALRPYLETAAGHAIPAAVIAGALLAAFGTGFWLKRRARHRFPEFEVEPRLGGAHAAGVGAVISFASATVPPASQRDQMPDYLRRA